MPNRNKEWAKACETEIERLQAINTELLAALEAMSEHFEIIGVGRKGSSIY